jgi:hypothetical protein
VGWDGREPFGDREEGGEREEEVWRGGRECRVRDQTSNRRGVDATFFVFILFVFSVIRYFLYSDAVKKCLDFFYFNGLH